MLNLINEQRDIDKIYLYAKDLSEPKYEHLMKNRWMAFMKILTTITQTEKKKVLIVFDDMIADIMTNKKFQSIIKELFIRSYLGLLGLISLIFLYQKT